MLRKVQCAFEKVHRMLKKVQCPLEKSEPYIAEYKKEKVQN